jgi:hypothetical protein
MHPPSTSLPVFHKGILLVSIALGLAGFVEISETGVPGMQNEDQKARMGILHERRY